MSTLPPRKRARRALSCTHCRKSKLKCDRNVPNCSSCVARGIQRSCRWGDDRDDFDVVPVYQAKATSPNADVDMVVEKVLQRLQGRENVESPSASSNVSSSTQKLPAIHGAANIIKRYAFTPTRTRNLDGRYFQPEKKNTYVDIGLVKKSLKALPPKPAVEKLMDLYLSELEPFRCLFNRIILRQQLDEFWRGVDELGIDGQCLVWPGDKAAMVQDPFFAAFKEPSHSQETSSLIFAGMAKQGLISVVFALIYVTLSSLHYPRKIEMGVFPTSFTEKDAERWSEQFHDLSRLHLTLSDYLEHTTLWSIQALYLQTSYYMDRRAIHHSQVNLATIIRLSVALGLNRLDSAVDDAKAMQKEASTKAKPKHTDREEEGHGNVTSTSFGVNMSSFEEGDLALRELGRKLWTSIVSTDFIMGAHMDCYYTIHDNINHTSPPSAIDDEELLSAAASSMLLRRPLKLNMSENAFPACWLAIARAGRLQVELENAKGSPLPYKDILRVDREYNAAIEAFPYYYKYSPATKGTNSLPRSIIIQRNALHEQVNFRLLRLHRLHMGKGFRDVQYLPSLNACFQGARLIADARIELEEVVTHSRKMIGYQIHLFHAALVIHLVLMFEVDQRKEEMQTGKQRDKGVYRLDSIENSVEQLEVAMHILKSHASPKDWPKGFDKLEAFLQRVKSEQSMLVMPLQSPRLAAADILASIPSSTLNPDATSMNLFDPPLSEGYSTLWSSDLDPDLWSLNALFPDYATNSIDLVDAFERVVWS